jgi:hypothetical protein
MKNQQSTKNVSTKMIMIMNLILYIMIIILIIKMIFI